MRLVWLRVINCLMFQITIFKNCYKDGSMSVIFLCHVLSSQDEVKIEQNGGNDIAQDYFPSFIYLIQSFYLIS